MSEYQQDDKNTSNKNKSNKKRQNAYLIRHFFYATEKTIYLNPQISFIKIFIVSFVVSHKMESLVRK